MDIRDVFWLSLKDLNEKKVRTALTIVMVVIGIAAIVALTSITAGISQSVGSQLNALGPTSIIVTSSSSTGFTIADIVKIQSLPNVTSITPILNGQANIYSGNQNTSVSIIGTTSQGLKQLLGGNVSLYDGTAFNDTITPGAVVGYSVAFPSTAAGQQVVEVGRPATLKILTRTPRTLSIPIVGILNSHGGFIVPVDTAVFLSLQSSEILLHRSSFNQMIVITSNASSVNATASLISTIYGSNARINTVAQLLQTASSIIGSIGLLFSVIASVSLLVAAIGIMNIMLISVFERTHEIGILKSIGFSNRHVLMIFLFQALIIGFIGGIIGIGIGAGTSFSLSTVLSGNGGSGGQSSQGGGASNGQNARAGSGNSNGFGGGGSSGSITFQPVFPILTITYALLISMIVSIVAGLYPAWRASRMEPIDALRSL